MGFINYIFNEPAWSYDDHELFIHAVAKEIIKEYYTKYGFINISEEEFFEDVYKNTIETSLLHNLRNLTSLVCPPGADTYEQYIDADFWYHNHFHFFQQVLDTLKPFCKDLTKDENHVLYNMVYIVLEDRKKKITPIAKEVISESKKVFPKIFHKLHQPIVKHLVGYTKDEQLDDLYIRLETGFPNGTDCEIIGSFLSQLSEDKLKQYLKNDFSFEDKVIPDVPDIAKNILANQIL